MPIDDGGKCLFKDVIAHDEKLFVADMGKRACYVGTVDELQQYVACSGTGSLRVMVSGMYDSGGPGPIIFLNPGETVNAGKFSQQLTNVFAPFFAARHKRHGLFDNASPHIGGTTVGTFYKLGIVRVRHPQNSPDLNPIELVWNRMQMQINRTLPWTKHITQDIFNEHIRRAWYVCASGDSFQKDMQHVAKCMIAAHATDGGNTYELK